MKSLVCAFRAAVIFTFLPAGVNFVRAQDAGVLVREVTLFSSGVGYFQHEGTVDGDGEAQLNFKTAQVNDILKSLILQDLDGGHVGVVTYPSQDPLAKTLASFQVDLSGDPSVSGLLDKLRGAEVTVRMGGESTVGTILCVEKKEAARKEDGGTIRIVEKPFLDLVTDKGLMSLDLEQVYTVKLDDAALQDELDRALDAVAGARDQDKKPVEIHFNGKGKRRVRLGYVVETPVWKASYRLVLPDDEDKDKDKDAKGTLQGWAMVDNQTDNDWNNVKLSLVSGRPISFQQDLYQPLYAERPTVVPEQYASLKPQEYEGGQSGKELPREALAEDGADKNSPVFPMYQQNKARVQAQAGVAAIPGAPPPAPASMTENIGASILPTTDTARVGELFQYTVSNVSLARQRSAMIPILNDPMPVEKLSIFNASVLATHPLNGVRLHNDTPDKKHLLQGPVTVFAEGRYAGDARLDDVPPGQTRLLSYGIDLETLVTTRDLHDQQSWIQTGKLVRGVLQITGKDVAAREYRVENKSGHDKTLVIEHPVRPGWKLVDTPAPVETTDTTYRFQQPVGAGKTETLTVREEKLRVQTLALVSSQTEELLAYSRTMEIPAPVQAALAKAVTLRQAAADSQRQINDRTEQIKTLADDQNRIRENLKTVGKTGDFAERQLKKLDEQESQIDRLRTEIEELRMKLEGQQRALADYLGGLNVG